MAYLCGQRTRQFVIVPLHLAKHLQVRTAGRAVSAQRSVCRARRRESTCKWRFRGARQCSRIQQPAQHACNGCACSSTRAWPSALCIPTFMFPSSVGTLPPILLLNSCERISEVSPPISGRCDSKQQKTRNAEWRPYTWSETEPFGKTVHGRGEWPCKQSIKTMRNDIG